MILARPFSNEVCHQHKNQSWHQDESYEFLFGVKPTGGFATLPLDGKLLASLSKEEDLNRALEIPQEQILEFYNQDKSNTSNTPVFTYDGVDEFHLFEFK